MKTNTFLKIISLATLTLFASSCKNKGNPLDFIVSRPPFAKEATTVIEPPPKPRNTNQVTLNPPEEDFGPQRPEQPTGSFEPDAGDPPIIPMPLVAPLPPEDDFGNIVPLNWGFAQCGNNVVSQEVLEDGTIIGEECEDGNAQDGDGCSSTCQKEFCGNGRVEPGEDCDPGQPPTSPPTTPPCWNQAIPTAECDKFCQYIICGDGVVNGDEQCDDCNRTDCDGCSANCKLQSLGEPPCNFSCTHTSPFTCTPPVVNLCANTVTCQVLCNGVCCPPTYGCMITANNTTTGLPTFGCIQCGAGNTSGPGPLCGNVCCPRLNQNCVQGVCEPP